MCDYPTNDENLPTKNIGIDIKHERTHEQRVQIWVIEYIFSGHSTVLASWLLG